VPGKLSCGADPLKGGTALETEMAANREVEQQALDMIAGRAGEVETAPAKPRMGGMEIAGAALWSLVLLGAIALGSVYLLH
jgi:hypothetical protein